VVDNAHLEDISNSHKSVTSLKHMEVIGDDEQEKLEELIWDNLT
jgi:hypothetical protein